MAATIYYASPVIGTTAPTTVQAFVVNSISATMFMGDTDTLVTLTHNFGLSTTANTNLQPWMSVQVGQVPASATVANFGFTLGTNTVTINKVSATGSGGVFNVICQRPFSEGT